MGPFGLTGINKNTFGIVTTNMNGFSLDNIIEFNISYYKEIWASNTTHYNEIWFQNAKKDKLETTIKIRPVKEMLLIPKKIVHL